jgi:hypothetical protein
MMDFLEEINDKKQACKSIFQHITPVFGIIHAISSLSRAYDVSRATIMRVSGGYRFQNNASPRFCAPFYYFE